MNLKQLQKQLGTQLRLRPKAHRREIGGRLLEPIDDHWTLDQILKKPDRLRLVNTSTGHSVELQSDNVKQYQSPDFLILRCQLTLEGHSVRIEPLSMRPGPVPIARYQTSRPKTTVQWVPETPVVCQGCTAAILFRPAIQIGLPADATSGPVSEVFCPRCARERGTKAMIPPRMNEEEIYAIDNPTFRRYVQVISHEVMAGVGSHPSVKARQVTTKGARVTPHSITFMFSRSGENFECSAVYHTLERSGIVSKDALIQYMVAEVVRQLDGVK